MTSEYFSQDDFGWVEEDDRFDLGLCFTLVQSGDASAVLAEFGAVNPAGIRKPADDDLDDWLDAVDDDGLGRRLAGTVGGWVWVLEEFSISAVLSPLPERLSAKFGTSITVQWDVNMLSTFVYARDGVVERRFELGREADPDDRTSPEGYLDEEDGIDWELPMAGGLCLQARLAGVIALTADSIEPTIVETCGES